jgi:IS5 family transposase
MPPLPTRLMAGLAILKHTFNLSDEEMCARWVENPYVQYLCGEEFFRHELPFDRSSMTRWRQRMGEERVTALLQESLSIAVNTGAMKLADTRRVIVDTTVQPKNMMFPTDAKLIHRARERLVRLARQAGLDLRQTYVRIGKLALIKHQRYAHAKQFKRANKALRKLKTYLGRTIRDIERQIDGEEELDAIFIWPLYQASTVLEQRQRQRGRKIYSLHAHEVECIGKGKAHAPYEFGVKVSAATTLQRSKGGQFALHAKRCRAILMTATRSRASSPRWKRPSATRSAASWPMPDTAATMRHRATSSGSSPPARSGASHRPSSAKCEDARRSSP